MKKYSSAPNKEGSSQNTDVVLVGKRRAYTSKPVYQILRQARSLQSKQLNQDGRIKGSCMKAIVSRNSHLYPNQRDFEIDFRSERDRLTDSTRFNQACRERHLNPEHVAEHIVFEGKAVVEKVLHDGLQVLGERVMLFDCALCEAPKAPEDKKEVKDE